MKPAAVFLLVACSSLAEAQTGGLLKIDATAVRAPSGCAATCTITLVLAETAPTDVGTAGSWKVSATFTEPAQTLPVSVTPSASGFFVTLTFDESQLNGRTNPKWSIAYVGERGPVLAPAAPSPTAAPKPPKTRAEADIYISGTFLAGKGSKPLYIADAKVNILRPLPRQTTRVGLSAEMLTNTGTELPVNRTEVDPDSIRAALAFEGFNAKKFGPFNGLLWTVKPAGGEFTRKHPTSNFVTEGTLRLSLTTEQVGKAWFTLYPLVGVEAGKNLNKPSTLFKRPVDLSNYNGIARAVFGIDSAIGIYVRDKDPKVLLSANYILRAPLTDEPYTTLEYVPTGNAGATERVKVVRMRQNLRPFTRTALAWNFSDSWSVALEHRFGSLPPLFELTRHQVSVGFIYRRSLAGKPKF